jgi:hypothetical protein
MKKVSHGCGAPLLDVRLLDRIMGRCLANTYVITIAFCEVYEKTDDYCATLIRRKSRHNLRLSQWSEVKTRKLSVQMPAYHA